MDEHGFYGKNEKMKLRLLKEWNGKAPGKVGVFCTETVPTESNTAT